MKLAKITLAENEDSFKRSSWTECTVLMVVFVTINIGIVTYYVYSQYYTKKDAPYVDFNTRTQTTIY